MTPQYIFIAIASIPSTTICSPLQQKLDKIQ